MFVQTVPHLMFLLMCPHLVVPQFTKYHHSNTPRFLNRKIAPKNLN
jgi:hypothetical protein